MPKPLWAPQAPDYARCPDLSGFDHMLMGMFHDSPQKLGSGFILAETHLCVLGLLMIENAMTFEAMNQTSQMRLIARVLSYLGMLEAQTVENLRTWIKNDCVDLGLFNQVARSFLAARLAFERQYASEVGADALGSSIVDTLGKWKHASLIDRGFVMTHLLERLTLYSPELPSRDALIRLDSRIGLSFDFVPTQQYLKEVDQSAENLHAYQQQLYEADVAANTTYVKEDNGSLTKLVLNLGWQMTRAAATVTRGLCLTAGAFYMGYRSSNRR